MNIKHLLLTLMAGLLMASCAEDVEKQAQPYLLRARQSYDNGLYALAKLQIDSIKLLFPKAFDSRAQAQALLIDVELAEASAGKAYADSLLEAAQTRVAPLTKGLYLDKDARYQDVGHYYAPRHRTEQNVGKSYLRPQVDEKGRFSIAAFLRGRTIDAHTLRVAAPDGTFVEMKAMAEPYVMKDALGRTERTDFVPDTCGNVVDFVALHADEALRATLTGEGGKVQMPFAKADVKALLQVGELARVLSAIGELERQQKEAERRILFFEQRRQSHTAEAAAQ